MFVKSNELRIVQMAERLSDELWSAVRTWDSFEKRSLGEQLVRACDSIGANIVEEFGRHHGPDSLKFYYVARASLEETTFWIRRAGIRYLLTTEKKLHHCLGNLIVFREV
jgi:four helix bundle protein